MDTLWGWSSSRSAANRTDEVQPPAGVNVAIDADRSAPVFMATDFDIDASPETVWDTLTDFDTWPTWQPGVKSIKTTSAFAAGARFKWSAGIGWIRGRIMTADRPSRVVWKGFHGRIESTHVWILEPVGPSRTHVHTDESWSGLLTRILTKTTQSTLGKQLDLWVPALKAEAERRA